MDSQLIADGTYFVAEAKSSVVAGDSPAHPVRSTPLIVGCGGWSKRKTLFGGDQWIGREAALLDPQHDAAKIRAFFIHPSWVRRGIGTMILEACESAALAAGFTRFEMGATLTGVPLYQARGLCGAGESRKSRWQMENPCPSFAWKRRMAKPVSIELAHRPPRAQSGCAVTTQYNCRKPMPRTIMPPFWRSFSQQENWRWTFPRVWWSSFTCSWRSLWSAPILKGFFQVRTAEAVVIQRMGKFLRVATAGINFKLPWLDQIAGRIDLRVQQLALDVETKTKDNVFVKIPVSVQYHVIPEKVYESFYKLANPKQQISSYVFNVILGHVPKMNLDDAFLQQSDLAGAIKEGLDDVMKTYGYAIDQALVTDIEPDEKVKSAMNEINAAQREQVAASARGEAEKILKVKQAEAEAESKALQGQGIANQRKAIIEGLKLSVESFRRGRRRHHAQGRHDARPGHPISGYIEGHWRAGQEQHDLRVAFPFRGRRSVPPDAGRGHDRADRREREPK